MSRTRWNTWAAALLGVALSACIPPASAPDSPLPGNLVPSTSHTTPPPGAIPSSIEHTWALLAADEPLPSDVPVNGCRSRWPIVWLRQTGDLLRLERRDHCGAPSEVAEGTARDGPFHLVGKRFEGRASATLNYELTFDAARQRYTGTRDGRRILLIPGAPCPSPASLCSISVRGRVFDERGSRVTDTGIRMTARSLNPSNPFETTVDVVGGEFILSNAPAGVEIEFTVVSDGWASRTRVDTVERGPEWVVNFGGPATPADPEAASYFLPQPFSLDGHWVIGAGNSDAAPAGPIRDCSLQSVYFDQAADRVTATVEDCGRYYEAVTGTFRDGRLRLDGTAWMAGPTSEPVRYDLTYDATSQHLVGVRNGRPFWLAPSVGTCPSPAGVCYLVLRGRVYDANGQPPTGAAVVRVKSLDPTTPFETTVPVINGYYVVNQVPPKVRLQVTAELEDGAQSSQVVSLVMVSGVLDFGQPVAADR